jgi:hypothetical protein
MNSLVRVTHVWMPRVDGVRAVTHEDVLVGDCVTHDTSSFAEFCTFYTHELCVPFGGGEVVVAFGLFVFVHFGH